MKTPIHDRLIHLAINDFVTLFTYVANADFAEWPPHAKRLTVAMAWTEDSLPYIHRVASFVVTDLLWKERERPLTVEEAHVRTIALRVQSSCEYVARTKNIDLRADRHGDREAARQALDAAYERAIWALTTSSSEGTIQ